MKKSESRLLSLFFSEPPMRVNPRQARQLSALSYGAAYEGLAQLAKRCVLVRERVGHANVYGVAFGSEAAREAFMRFASERREEAYRKYNIKEAARRTVERVRRAVPATVSIVLFGSVARLEAKKGSDVDLLVILSGTKGIAEKSKLVSAACATVSLEVGLEVNPVTVSAGEFARMLESDGATVAKEAARGGVPLFGAEAYFELALRPLPWRGSNS